MKKVFFIYDGRYLSDEDSASIYSTADTLKEAKELAKLFGDCVIVEGTIQNGLFTFEKSHRK